MKQSEAYRKIIAHYGERNQILKLIEECGELIAALSRDIALGYGSFRQSTIEEIADVSVMIDQLEIILSDRLQVSLEAEKERKIERTLERIGV